MFMSVCGVVFGAGRITQQVDTITTRVDECDKERQSMIELVFDIHSRVQAIEKEVESVARHIK